MIVAVLVLAILLITITAVTLAAKNNTATAYHTESANQALAAADAGAQAALFRLNNAPTSSGASSGSGTLGNGATYSYTVSTLSSQSSACTGLWINTSGINQDCITSTGTANGVSQTVEDRIAGYAPANLFPINGLYSNFGISACSLVIGGSSTPTDIGSNGSISLCNSLTMTGNMKYYLGSGASAPYCWNNTCAQNNGCSGTCVMAQQTSAIAAGALSATVWTNAYTTGTANDSNSLINWGGVAQPTSSDDWMVGNSGNNNDTIQLPGGVYFFCGITLASNDQIQYEIEAGDTSPVQIYIGSTSGPGSDCSSAGSTAINNSGPLTIGCTSTSSGCSPVEPSDDIQIYVYGNPTGCTATSTSSCPGITSTNTFTANADIYAPFSAITGQNGWTLTGAITAGYVSSTNTMTINFPATGGMPASSNSTTFYPSAHGVCQNNYASAGC